ncbi:MAG: recombinase zinc beta ribbon domain-containing protein, partial [Deltaproteobacteria bacterium]|nr:recombinase zinc beta ribbon domain-containing protein [Deltaproteobacteria bacterium]
MAPTNKLNEAGHRKRSGKKWDMRVINRIIKSPAGKIKWREVIYEGMHDPIVSEALFNQTQEILQERQEELSGRLFHNGDEHLLSGIIKCGKCRSHMVGFSTLKNDRNYPYYLCNKRWSTHDCEQDYIRGDLLETAIIQDLKNMFMDDQFMLRIWEEANKRLAAEKPDLEREIKRIETQMAKATASVNRYFEAFESGKLKPEMCNEKVSDLNARIRELDIEKKGLEARRERLELPAIDKEMLRGILADFEKVMEEGTNPQKKHLMQKLINRVVVHDRRTVEIWYWLPNSSSFGSHSYLAPRVVLSRTFLLGFSVSPACCFSASSSSMTDTWQVSASQATSRITRGRACRRDSGERSDHAAEKRIRSLRDRRVSLFLASRS